MLIAIYPPGVGHDEGLGALEMLVVWHDEGIDGLGTHLEWAQRT